MEFEQSLDSAARQDEQLGIKRDAHREGAPLAGHQCPLAEHLARPTPREQLDAIEQIDGPGDDEVERVGVITRVVDGLVLPERNLAEEGGGLRALRCAEVAEGGLREEGLPGAWTQHDGATTAAISEADPLEHVLCAADGAVERIGVARAVGDDAIEETLAVVPHAALQLRQSPRITLRPLAVPEVERLRDHVRQADREGQQPRHQMQAEEAESEPQAAIAQAVATVDQADQRLG